MLVACVQAGSADGAKWNNVEYVPLVPDTEIKKYCDTYMRNVYGAKYTHTVNFWVKARIAYYYEDEETGERLRIIVKRD